MDETFEYTDSPMSPQSPVYLRNEEFTYNPLNTTDHYELQPAVYSTTNLFRIRSLDTQYASENDLAELKILLTSWNLVELYGFCQSKSLTY